MPSKSEPLWTVTGVVIVIVVLAAAGWVLRLYQADKLFTQGSEANYRKDYDLAISCYTEAIRVSTMVRPSSYVAVAYHNRGFAYREKGKLDNAIADFTEAIRLDPKNDLFYLARGGTYEQKGRGSDFDDVSPYESSEAVRDYSEAIRLKPDRADPYYRRAHAYLCMRDHEKAIVDLTAGLNIVLATWPEGPDDKKSDYFFELAYIYAKEKKFDKVVKLVQKALELAATDRTKDNCRYCLDRLEHADEARSRDGIEYEIFIKLLLQDLSHAQTH
jgi:tetratricopeptide (TPR) repeat protein